MLKAARLVLRDNSHQSDHFIAPFAQLATTAQEQQIKSRVQQDGSATSLAEYLVMECAQLGLTLMQDLLDASRARAEAFVQALRRVSFVPKAHILTE